MNRDILKFIAYALMIFDHVVAVFYPESFYGRLPGRVVMPIFITLGVIGLQKSRNVTLYLSSLVILSVIAQYPYSLAIQKTSPNDMYFVSVALICVYLANEMKSIIPVVIGMICFYIMGFIGGALFVLVAHIANEFKGYLEFIKPGNLKINKYWVYSIYPLHLLVLGVLRSIIYIE